MTRVGQVCHGIPDSRPLESGDIINVDITVFRDGVHGDCSETFLVSAALDMLYSGVRIRNSGYIILFSIMLVFQQAMLCTQQIRSLNKTQVEKSQVHVHLNVEQVLFQVGDVDKSGVELVNVARQCLYRGIEQCGPGRPFTGDNYEQLDVGMSRGGLWRVAGISSRRERGGEIARKSFLPEPLSMKFTPSPKKV